MVALRVGKQFTGFVAERDYSTQVYDATRINDKGESVVVERVKRVWHYKPYPQSSREAMRPNYNGSGTIRLQTGGERLRLTSK